MKTNRIPSGSEQAKIDRSKVEQLKQVPNEPNEPEPVQCGLKNPCVFGLHSSKIDRYET